MDIQDAATYFDTCQVTDINDALLFKGQLNIFDRSTSDGLATFRRTITAGPGIIATPANKLVKIETNTFLTGRTTFDSFNGISLREILILQDTNSDSELFDVIDLVSDDPALQTSRTFVAWQKVQKEELRTSEQFNLYNIYFPGGYFAAVGQVFSSQLDSEAAPTLYLIAAIERSTEGFIRAVAYELGAGALQTVSYYRFQSYDPASGDASFLAPVSLQMLSVRYKAGYELSSFSSAKFKVGDHLFFTSDTSAKVKDYLEAGGIKYDVKSIKNNAFGTAGLRAIHGRIT